MTWNTGKPALANAISADVPDIEECLNVLGAYKIKWIPARLMAPATTNGAAALASKEYAATGDIEYYAFDGTTEEYVSFSFVMPTNWNLGTVKFKVYWLPGASACTAGDKVEWEFAGRSFADDEPINNTLGTAQVISDTVTAGKDTDLHISGPTPALTLAGSLAENEFVVFELSRNVGSANDDMTEDAFLFGVTMEYQISAEHTAWS